MKIFTVKYYTLLALTLFCASCNGNNSDEGLEFMAGLLPSWCSMHSDYYDEIIFTDLEDGTIQRDRRGTNHGPCVGTNISHNYSYIKKCLQGQVYRPLPDNDCRGTGTAGDNWGAQKYQFCPTNDRACDMLEGYIYVADPTKSPAAKSCADDATAGLNWELPRGNEYYLPDNISAYAPEIPLDSTNLIWLDYPHYEDKTRAIYFDINGDLQYGPFQLKNEQLYVLCISKDG